MKRLLTILLTLSLLLSLAACGSGKDSASDAAAPGGSTASQEPETGGAQPGADDAQSDSADEPEETQPAEDSQAQPEKQPEKEPEKQPDSRPAPEARPGKAGGETGGACRSGPARGDGAAASGDALSILAAVWNAYSDDEKFPALPEDAPISMDISDTDNISYLLTFPAEDAALIDGAASLTHMMNLNTFTCGAFHAVSAQDVTKLADDLHTAIADKQWMCGFPDKLVVVTLDQYVISMYGHEDLINTFRDKLQAAYSSAAIAYEEAIV